ncbi:hypothetical protein DFQ27_009114 [Actinomortierella ambigua]|uniref:Cas12f1-like TNB domain-containing protein n=1 Tax=Actinomortierella ambigua TaxID=1343610 RepID=A0A9P6TXZ2_9FUNG|nr:hypothetical protein DFQ27_009114 [Actinomortierella ambigua]
MEMKWTLFIAITGIYDLHLARRALWRWMERQKQQEVAPPANQHAPGVDKQEVAPPANQHAPGVDKQEVAPPANQHAPGVDKQEPAASGSQQAVSQKSQRLYTSVSDIETSLPPLRGPNAVEYTNYKQHLDKYQHQLDNFYNDAHRFKKFRWFSQRAKQEEYRRMTDSLLKMVDGSIGAQRKETNKVIIGVGLGTFSSTSRLTSMHESFQSYFVQTARSLGYIVVGVNEYYTSKKCPTCMNFVSQTSSIRRLYCRHCQKYLHRDVMAGHNICNALLGHLEHHQRPLYLQPVAADGTYPWMQKQEGVGQTLEPSSSSVPQSRRKRAATTVGQEAPEQGKVPQHGRKRSAPVDEGLQDSKRRARLNDDDEQMDDDDGGQEYESVGDGDVTE